MKQFTFKVSQDDTTITNTYELNDDKAKDLGLIVGTALNFFNQKLVLTKQLGGKMINASKDLFFEFIGEGLHIDSRLIAAGVDNMKTAVKFKAKYTEAGQKKFAMKVWNGIALILLVPEVKDIAEITGMSLPVIPANLNLSAISEAIVVELPEVVPAPKGVQAIVLPKGRRKAKTTEEKVEAIMNEG